MEEKVYKSYAFLEQLEAWLLSLGLSETSAHHSKVLISILGIVVLAVVANFIAKKIIVAILTMIVKRTKNTWDDYLVKRKVFHKLSHLAPALVIQFTIGIALYEYSPNFSFVIERLTYVYMVIVWLLVINSLLNALHDIYLTFEMSKNRNIKGYIQLIKIIVFAIGAILIISILINKSPAKLLVGMGASAAIMTLVFKDTILGLVASIQASANNMVNPGDWIEMPARNADGSVLEITLNTVKVQNWDNTITTFPTYALVSESFINWKGMQESAGRRIKRTIFVDVRSVQFASVELLEKLKQIQILKPYLEEKINEIKEYNEKIGAETNMPVNGRRLTNIGVFRKYLELYLADNPNVSKEATSMVRHLQPTEKGIPLEVYCFSSEKAWVKYEEVQADIFDHIFAIIPQFELRIFQSVSGNDLAKN
ncbi:MAG: mechanosensitive ion channel family protein [Bacteroidales bacterium]